MRRLPSAAHLGEEVFEAGRVAPGLGVVDAVDGVQRHARAGLEDLVDERVGEVGDGVDAAEPVVDGAEGGGETGCPPVIGLDDG